MASDISSPSRKKDNMRQLTSHYSNTSLFDAEAKSKLFGLSLANQQKIDSEDSTQLQESSSFGTDYPRELIISDVMLCSCCQISFSDREEQLLHYKCDWHRYNLHLRLKGLPSISEEEFEILLGDDVSSISGSDDESDEEKDLLPVVSSPVLDSPIEEDTSNSLLAAVQRLNKVYFRNEQGELVSVYKCLLVHKKNPPKSIADLEILAGDIMKKQKWAVLVYSSGHFAGAVFDGKTVIDHKTFHRYTVRAKRGNAQSSRDAKGNAPKSAGSSLRRYNEAALTQEVQELLSTWKSHLESCSLIFVRIPAENRSIFFGGKNPFLLKDDLRIRVIPFPTKRPTFNEVKRIQQMLSSIECYGQEADVKNFLPLSPKRIYCQETNQLEIVQREDSPIKKSAVQSQKSPVEDSEVKDKEEPVKEDTDESEDEFDINPVGPGNPLMEFEINTGRKKKRKRPRPDKSKSSAVKDPSASEEDTEQMTLKNSLFTACKSGKVDDLDRVINQLHSLYLGNSSQSQSTTSGGCVLNNSQDPETQKNSSLSHVNLREDELDTVTNSSCPSEKKRVAEFLSSPLGDKANTFLHLASEGGHREIISRLLHEGANPAIKNKSGKTPYVVGNTEVKNTYRRFMALFPEKFDYAKAQIPGPLTPEMEASKKQKDAEKKALKKKATQEKNKIKKAEEMKKKEENEEKERYLRLSDREKRALAAERRLLKQQNDSGTSSAILSRCFQCGADISGKVPFEYADFRFCTTNCLREHRAKVKS